MYKTLLEIFEEEKLHLSDRDFVGTSKFTAHPYAEDYDKIFEPWREKKFNFLEIGALYGASTIIWDKYFPNADITVVDIDIQHAEKNIKGRVDENRVKLLQGDAYTPSFSETLGNFDIINDDGPHTIDSMKQCIRLYYPKLNEGGVIIIEDIKRDDWFDKLIEVTPTKNYECINYCQMGKGVSDSRVFVIRK